MDKIDDVGKKSTINDGRRNRRSIEDMCSKIESEKSLAVRCTNKKPVCDIVDEALWMWFVQERRRGTPISGPILIEKALVIHGKIENAIVGKSVMEFVSLT